MILAAYCVCVLMIFMAKIKAFCPMILALSKIWSVYGFLVNN